MAKFAIVIEDQVDGGCTVSIEPEIRAFTDRPSDRTSALGTNACGNACIAWASMKRYSDECEGADRGAPAGVVH